MARLTRKEMKRDEVQEALGQTYRLVVANRRTILLAIAGVVVLAFLFLGFRLYQGFRAERGYEALDQALLVYRAPIDATAPDPENEESPSFAEEAVRDERAEQLLEEVHSSYSSTTAGDLAGIYLAEIATKDGDLDRARQLWSDFVERQNDHLMVASVKLNLISLERQQGNFEELAAELRQALEGDERILPRDVILFQLARTLNDLGEDEEAQELFQQLIDDFPRSPYSSEARRYVEPAPGSELLPFGT